MSAIKTATSKNLINFLAAPSRVASKMDWKQSSSAVLSIDIGPDRIGLAVAPHPGSHQPILTLPPLQITHTRAGNRRVLSQTCIQNMASIVKEHQVCALLVSWPVQHEGRCGKPCGQVLHALDSLVQEDSIVSKARPVCLWDDRHVKEHLADEFGRDPLFGNKDIPASKTIHRASQEQYQHHDCSSAVAAQVWQDFCHTHWPQIETEGVIEYTEDLIEEEDDEEVELKMACV